MIDLGRVTSLTGGGGPCEGWFRVLLFCCRGGSAACVAACVLVSSVRGAVVPELITLGVDAPASMNKRGRALFKIMLRLVAIKAVSLIITLGCRACGQ